MKMFRYSSPQEASVLGLLALAGSRPYLSEHMERIGTIVVFSKTTLRTEYYRHRLDRHAQCTKMLAQ